MRGSGPFVYVESAIWNDESEERTLAVGFNRGIPEQTDVSIMKRLRFDDFDEYANTIRHVELDVRLLHSCPERLFWSLQELDLESLRIQFAVEGSGVLAQGKMHRDGWGLYFQLSGAPVSVNGEPIGPGALAVLPPNAELSFLGRGPVRWFSVFVPDRLLMNDAVPPRRSSSVFVLPGRSRLLKRLDSHVRESFGHAARLGLSSVCSPDFSSLQDDLLATVKDVLWSGEASPSAGSAPNSRRLAVRAVELIHDCQDVKLSVRDLAAILHVSERTLLYAFRDQFDVSPQAFLINHRLHQARKHLQSSDPEHATVAAVAAKNGFFDFGRFAVRYRQLFGEHPSETLRRRR